MTSRRPAVDATTPRAPLRERILDAASDTIVLGGWSAVRMGELAAAVGVSRQTVYNEFGSKPQIASALVLREIGHALEQVTEGITTAPDLESAIGGAIVGGLRYTSASPLVQAILRNVVSGGGGALLPLVTTESHLLFSTATDLVLTLLREQGLVPPEAPEEDMETIIEMAVRLVVSHLLQSPADPDLVARRILSVLLPALYAHLPGPTDPTEPTEPT